MGNLVMSIVVARLVAPEAYGVFAVALTVWTVLSALSEFGLGADLVRARDPERRAPTVATLGVLIGCVAAAGHGRWLRRHRGRLPQPRVRPKSCS